MNHPSDFSTATAKDSCQTSPTDLNNSLQPVRPIPILKSHRNVHKANPLTDEMAKLQHTQKVDPKKEVMELM